MLVFEQFTSPSKRKRAVELGDSVCDARISGARTLEHLEHCASSGSVRCVGACSRGLQFEQCGAKNVWIWHFVAGVGSGMLLQGVKRGLGLFAIVARWMARDNWSCRVVFCAVEMEQRQTTRMKEIWRQLKFIKIQSMGDLWAGIDVGGTKILCVLVDDSGSIVAQHKVKTGAERTSAAVLARVLEAMSGARAAIPEQVGIFFFFFFFFFFLKKNQKDKARRVAGAGLAVPGPVDSEKRLVHRAVNLGWENVDLSSFSEKLGVEVWFCVLGFGVSFSRFLVWPVLVARQRRQHGRVWRSDARRGKRRQKLLRRVCWLRFGRRIRGGRRAGHGSCRLLRRNRPHLHGSARQKGATLRCVRYWVLLME
jgi:hypothetical protein